jgi:hypothetical protein
MTELQRGLTRYYTVLYYICVSNPLLYVYLTQPHNPPTYLLTYEKGPAVQGGAAHHSVLRVQVQGQRREGGGEGGEGGQVPQIYPNKPPHVH